MRQCVYVFCFLLFFLAPCLHSFVLVLLLVVVVIIFFFLVAIDGSLRTTITKARASLVERCLAILLGYRKHCASSSASGQVGEKRRKERNGAFIVAHLWRLRLREEERANGRRNEGRKESKQRAEFQRELNASILFRI